MVKRKTKWTKQMDEKLVKMYEAGEKNEKIAKEISRVSGKRITGHAVSGRIWRLKRDPNYVYLSQFRRRSTKQEARGEEITPPELDEKEIMDEDDELFDVDIEEEKKTEGVDYSTYTQEEKEKKETLKQILQGIGELQQKLDEKIEIEVKGFEKIRVEIERIYLLLCHRFYGGIFIPDIIWDEDTGSGANRIPGFPSNKCYPTLYVWPEETPMAKLGHGDWSGYVSEKNAERYKLKPSDPEEDKIRREESGLTDRETQEATTREREIIGRNICANLSHACWHTRHCKHTTVIVYIHEENIVDNPCYTRFLECIGECKDRDGRKTKLTVIDIETNRVIYKNW